MQSTITPSLVSPTRPAVYSSDHGGSPHQRDVERRGDIRHLPAYRHHSNGIIRSRLSVATLLPLIVGVAAAERVRRPPICAHGTARDGGSRSAIPSACRIIVSSITHLGCISLVIDVITIILQGGRSTRRRVAGTGNSGDLS